MSGKHPAHRTEQGFAVTAVVIAALVIVLVAVAAFALMQKQSAKPSSTANTQTEAANVSGIVTRGPITPTCNDNRPCYSPVANHTIEVLDSGDNVVATTTTSSTGRYSIRLKLGHYTLKLVPGVGSFAKGDNEVDVTDSPKEFDLTIDSGIR